MSTSAREKILILTKEHDLPTSLTEFDKKAMAMNNLAENDTTDFQKSEAFTALVNLRRAKVISTQEAHHLLFALIEEECVF